MSDDDGADLFGGESEDLYSDIGSSIDMQALTLHAKELEMPPDDGVVSETREYEAGVDHLVKDENAASPRETQCVLGEPGLDTDKSQDNTCESLAREQTRDQGNEVDVEANNENGAADEVEGQLDDVADQTVLPGSPIHFKPNDQQDGVHAPQNEQDGDGDCVQIAHDDDSDRSPVSPLVEGFQQMLSQKKQSDEIVEEGDDDDIVKMAHLNDYNQHSLFQLGELSQDFTLNEGDKPGTTESPTWLKKIASQENLGESNIASVPEAPEVVEVNLTPNECVGDACETAPPAIPEQEKNRIALNPRGSVEAGNSLIYTVESLFPVVYESDRASAALLDKASDVLRSAEPTSPSKSREQKRISTRRHQRKSIGSRLASLQGQLDAARREIANLTRTSRLQISLAETDNKKLSQRNARLKNQLAATTAELQRSNAESAKLKTENELYATRLPRLQAELLEETSQVDHSQAQSVQTQIVVTQLKARSHVLQTRNHTLEAQHNKLTQQLRECQQQLKRKSTALQQQTEKTSKIEGENIELKSVHMQELLTWKNRMTSALQRFEHDKSKLDAEWRSKDKKELREAKERAEKAMKKWRTVDATAVRLQEQLKHYKRETLIANETNQRHVAEIRTLESLLRKSHKTEATLRNELTACKTRLHSLQEEKRRHTGRPTAMESRRRQLEHQIPLELVLPLTDSSDDEDNQESLCYNHCHSMKLDFPDSLQSPVESICKNCLGLQHQLHQTREELRRIRALHSAELNAQGLLLDSLIPSRNS